MFKVIVDLLRHHQLSFEEGYVKLFGQYGIMVPVKTVVEIQKRLEKRGLENVFYIGAKESGAEWIRQIFKKYKMNKIQEQAEWGERTFTLAGNGQMEVVTWSKEKARMVYRVHDSALARIYGKAEHPVDQIPRGWFAGAACVFFDKDVDAVEVKCKATGDRLCEFLVKPRSAFDMRKKEVKRQLTLPSSASGT